jgi:hypothetical protein
VVARTAGTRSLAFTRTSGPRQPVAYRLEWHGNDGTFACTESLRLPYGQDTPLDITVAPRSAGVHSAILRLVDPAAGALVHQLMATIVAAEPLPAGAGPLTLQGTTNWLEASHYYFRVPPGTAVLSVEAALSQGSNVWVYLCGPDRIGRRGTQTGGGDHLTVSFDTPSPGVWELAVGNGTGGAGQDFQSPAQVPAHYTISVSLRRAPGAI